jgi:hypothetical protein
MIIKLVKLTSIMMVMLVVVLGATLRLGFETNHFEPFWNVLQFTGVFLLLIGVWYIIAPPHLSITRTKSIGLHPAFQRSIEDRLDELERLKRRDVLTPEEYTAKRQEILKDL